MFFTQFIYNDNKNIYKFIKNVKWKKTYQRLFNKNTPLYAEPSAKQQNFWQLWRNLSERTVLLFEKPYNFFHGANAQINFITHFSSPVRFRLLFKDPVSPLHEERTFWIPPFRENLWTAASKCWFISHWLTSLNIKTSKIWREQKLNNKKTETNYEEINFLSLIVLRWYFYKFVFRLRHYGAFWYTLAHFQLISFAYHC